MRLTNTAVAGLSVSLIFSSSDKMGALVGELRSFFCSLVTWQLCYVKPVVMSRHSWTLEPGGSSPGDGAAKEIDSPGEYKLASSLAPACCGPHLSAPRPGPCGSGLCVSAPQTFFSPILAISPLWARPLQSLYSQTDRNQRSHQLLSR